MLPRHGNDRELSKFETIKITKNYIHALNRMPREVQKGAAAEAEASAKTASVKPVIFRVEVKRISKSYLQGL